MPKCTGLFKQCLLSSSVNICTPKRTLSSFFDSKLGNYFAFISLEDFSVEDSAVGDDQCAVGTFRKHVAHGLERLLYFVAFLIFIYF